MIRLLAALPFLVALAQSPPDPDTFTRDQVNGRFGTQLDSQLTRFAEYGFSGTVLVVRDGLIAPPHPPAQEAFGWHVETAPDGRPRIQKGGGSDDFASHLLYYPRERLAIIWASNNLRQRWRQTLNQAIPALLLASTPLSLPPVAAVPKKTIDARGGRYLSSGKMFELRVSPGYLYVTPNRLDIPTHVMFFPQDADHFTAFDPQRRAVMRLEFSGTDRQLLAFASEDGRRVSAQRATGDP